MLALAFVMGIAACVALTWYHNKIVFTTAAIIGVVWPIFSTTRFAIEQSLMDVTLPPLDVAAFYVLLYASVAMFMSLCINSLERKQHQRQRAHSHRRGAAYLEQQTEATPEVRIGRAPTETTHNGPLAVASAWEDLKAAGEYARSIHDTNPDLPLPFEPFADYTLSGTRIPTEAPVSVDVTPVSNVQTLAPSTSAPTPSSEDNSPALPKGRMHSSMVHQWRQGMSSWEQSQVTPPKPIESTSSTLRHKDHLSAVQPLRGPVGTQSPLMTSPDQVGATTAAFLTITERFNETATEPEAQAPLAPRRTAAEADAEARALLAQLIAQSPNLTRFQNKAA